MNHHSELLEGQRVWLDPHLADHREFLYRLMTDPGAGGAARFHGATLGPAEIEASIWDQVLAQFVVRGRDSGAALGLVVLSTPSFVDRYCHFSMVASPENQGRGVVAEGAILAIEYGFLTWDFRKLYLDVLDDNLKQFGATLHRFATTEGTLTAHSFRNGSFVDMHKLAIYADTWRTEARHLVAAVTGGTKPGMGARRVTHR